MTEHLRRNAKIAELGHELERGFLRAGQTPLAFKNAIEEAFNAGSSYNDKIWRRGCAMNDACYLSSLLNNPEETSNVRP